MYNQEILPNGHSVPAGDQFPRGYTVSCLSLSSVDSKPTSHLTVLLGNVGLEGASGRFMSTLLLFCQGVLLIFASLLETTGWDNESTDEGRGHAPTESFSWPLICLYNLCIDLRQLRFFARESTTLLNSWLGFLVHWNTKSHNEGLPDSNYCVWT